MNRLKRLRKKKRLTQQGLAEEFGVTYRTIQNWESEVNQLSIGKAKKLAEYFGVSVGYLLG